MWITIQCLVKHSVHVYNLLNKMRKVYLVSYVLSLRFVILQPNIFRSSLLYRRRQTDTSRTIQLSVFEIMKNVTSAL